MWGIVSKLWTHWFSWHPHISLAFFTSLDCPLERCLALLTLSHCPKTKFASLPLRYTTPSCNSLLDIKIAATNLIHFEDFLMEFPVRYFEKFVLSKKNSCQSSSLIKYQLTVKVPRFSMTHSVANLNKKLRQFCQRLRTNNIHFKKNICCDK